MLVRFRVANHRSLRDGVELSLVSPGLHGAVPAKGGWVDASTRVAGIFGPNASGKSTILHALDFMVKAIMLSATKWGDRNYFPYTPCLLDAGTTGIPSEYEIDLIVDDIRYTYGFMSDADGIKSEWLHSYRTNRRTTLFERSGPDGSSIVFGRSLPGENSTMAKLVRPTNLFLSVAANSNHPALRRIHHRISNHIRYAKFTDSDRSVRLRWVKKLLEDDKLLKQTLGLMKFADLGLTDIRLAEQKVPSEVAGTARDLYKFLGKDEPEEVQLKFIDDFEQDLRKQLEFVHQGTGSLGSGVFGIGEESSGTVAWLSIGVPALKALQYGDTFMVDEIDSSLHTKLTAALIGIFKDPEINRTGAQLIFTSHDLSLLGNLVGRVLEPEEIWFMEKREGLSELFSLQEFNFRGSDNFEKRYLEGRYGAVPIIEPDELRSALLDAKVVR